jgi:3-oxoadipate enol-lactonase
MESIEIGTLCLKYRLDGDPQLPVLVLSNSLGTQMGMWVAQMEQLSKYFRVLRYDTRGHGLSSAPAGPYTVAEMGKDVLQLLDALRLERVHFCGLSLGGMVGQWLGVHAAHRLSKLVLANTAATIGNSEGWNARIDAVRATGMESVATAILERWFSPTFRAKNAHTVAALGLMLKEVDSEGYVASCAAVRDADQRKMVSQIRLPTLVIGGSQDLVTPISETLLLAGAIPGAGHLELDVGHLANVEAPEAFSSGVTNFIYGS